VSRVGRPRPAGQACEEHGKQFCYTCKTCNRHICLDCLIAPAKVPVG
jgi:hypothetical protein